MSTSLLLLTASYEMLHKKKSWREGRRKDLPASLLVINSLVMDSGV